MTNKRVMQKIKYIVSLVLIFLSINSFSQNFPKSTGNAVSDFTGSFLSTNEINALESKLRQFERETSSAVVIAIVESLDGYDKASYAFGLAED
jgi:uncharacterized membrane protein YgcG